MPPFSVTIKSGAINGVHVLRLRLERRFIMAKANRPTKVELEEVFELIDGELWRKAFVTKTGHRWEPKLVLNKKNHSDGYCLVWFKERRVQYHVIVYILSCGDISEGLVVDHINGNKIDNNINNLRAVSPRANAQNYHSHRKGKLVGGSFDRVNMKWETRIMINKKAIYLGYYHTEKGAHDVYCKALELMDFYVCNKSFRELVKTDLSDLNLDDGELGLGNLLYA